MSETPPPDQPYGAGTPAAGSTPPPPPPPPPAGPGGGYGSPAPYGAAPYSPTEAISYGWAKFKARPAEMLVPVLVFLVVVIVIEVVVQLLLGATLLGTHSCTQTFFGQRVETQCGPGLFVRLLGIALSAFVVGIIVQAIAAGLIKNALLVADGGQASVGELFAWVTKPNVLTAALIVSAATAVGTFLCYLPGLVVAFLLNWVMFFVVDQDLAPMDAVRASVQFVTSNLANTLVFYLLGLVVAFVGALVCGVGLLVAAPVVLIGAAYTFRRLHGREVSAPA